MKYNALKLSVHREFFHNLPVLIVGAGAVGTYLMEYLAKMGCSPDCLDFDAFTAENAAKHSGIIRTPEDIGRNKAVCAAERVRPLLDEGCTSHGIDGDLCAIGPEVLARYRYVIAAVDNVQARVLLSELVCQLDKSRRPKVLMCGTNDEAATSVLLNHEQFCLRCLADEELLMKDSVRHSCTMPEVRTFEDGTEELVRTTNMASSMAAHLVCEQLRADVIGIGEVVNRRLTYTSYPVLDLSASTPLPKKGCPGCAVKPPAEMHWLEGNMMNTTLKEVAGQIGAQLNSWNFDINVHQLFYKKIYAEYAAEMVCSSCGRVKSVFKHTGRMTEQDLRCKTCGSPLERAGTYHAFTWAAPPHLQAMTMYDLGFPLGGHIEVIVRKEGKDILDGGWTRMVFAFKEDAKVFREINKL